MAHFEAQQGSDLIAPGVAYVCNGKKCKRFMNASLTSFYSIHIFSLLVQSEGNSEFYMM